MNAYIKLSQLVRRFVVVMILVLAVILVLPCVASGDNGQDENGVLSWMRVYTTGRQPLTSYPEGTPLDPAGHLVGTDLVAMPSGDSIVAAWVSGNLICLAEQEGGYSCSSCTTTRPIRKFRIGSSILEVAAAIMIYG